MAITKNSQIDLNGNEMILDADADTKIDAATDDEIHFTVAGNETVYMGVTSYNASDRLVLTNVAGNASATIVAGTSGESSIFMADGTSGDASYRGYLQYQHANDNWNFGTAATLAMKIDSAGIVTQPLQPAFGARVNGNISGFNPSSLTTVVVFNLEFETDRNSDYNTSTGLFTAPVDGVYWFNASIYSNYTFSQSWLVVNSSRASFNDFSVSGSANAVFASFFYIELDANDTVGFHPYKGGETSVLIYDNNYHTYFRGGLLY